MADTINNKGKVNVTQIENITLDKVKRLFADGSIPEEKLILVTVPKELSSLKERLDVLTITKTYDLTSELSTDTGVNDFIKLDGDSVFEYDSVVGAYRIKGKVRIVAPRCSSYLVTFNIVKRLEDGEISTDTDRYKIQDNTTTIKIDKAKYLDFECSTTIWVSAITLAEYKIPEIPTKFSQLTNDLDLVNCTINETEGSIEFNIG